MMVILQLITTGSGNSVKLVVFQVRKHTTRNTKCIVELIVRIVHLIDTKHSFKTALVKGLIVCNKR